MNAGLGAAGASRSCGHNNSTWVPRNPPAHDGRSPCKCGETVTRSAARGDAADARQRARRPRAAFSRGRIVGPSSSISCAQTDAEQPTVSTPPALAHRARFGGDHRPHRRRPGGLGRRQQRSPAPSASWLRLEGDGERGAGCAGRGSRRHRVLQHPAGGDGQPRDPGLPGAGNVVEVGRGDDRLAVAGPQQVDERLRGASASSSLITSSSSSSGRRVAGSGQGVALGEQQRQQPEPLLAL